MLDLFSHELGKPLQIVVQRDQQDTAGERTKAHGANQK